MDTEKKTSALDESQCQVITAKTFLKVRAINALKNFGKGKVVRFTMPSGITVKFNDVDVLIDEIKRESQFGEAFIWDYKNIISNHGDIASMFSDDFRREGTDKAWIDDIVLSFWRSIKSALRT